MAKLREHVRKIKIGQWLDLLTGPFIPPHFQIKQTIEGLVPRQRLRQLCLFSHFDPQNRFDAHVLYLLKSLHDLGAEIIIISTSKRLPESELKKVRPFCSQIIRRVNLSRDFGSWKIGLDWVGDVSHYDQIILANDSVYGPLYPLQKMFDTMAQQDLDFWGITDSWDTAYHIQTFFIVFNKRIINTRFFKHFWARYRFYRTKRVVISRYEIGLTQKALKAGLKIAAYCNYRDVRAYILREYPTDPLGPLLHHQAPLNPVHYFWRHLVVAFQCPFIKTELLKYNPEKLAKLYEWESVVNDHTDYNPELIVNHLQRFAKNHAI